MKTIALYSDVDDFVVTSFVAAVCLMFFLSYLWNKLKSQLHYLSKNDETEYDVRDYALNFKNDTNDFKNVGFKSKFILTIFSLVIILTPLHEFIVTLRPIQFFKGGMCFPF